MDHPQITVNRGALLGCCPGFPFVADRNIDIVAYLIIHLKNGCKAESHFRPPYVVDLLRCNTTTYGGIFNPWNSIASPRTCNQVMLIIILITLLIIISKPDLGKPPTKLISVGGYRNTKMPLSLFPAFKNLSGWNSEISRVGIPESIGLGFHRRKMRLPFCDGRRIVIQI